MNYRLIFRLLGNILKIEALFMLLPLGVSLIYGEGDFWAFLWSIPILFLAGALLSLCRTDEKAFRTKEALVAAALTWLAISLFGALPFLFSGCFRGPVDCIFESVSGFTTTGSSVLSDVEALPRGILFWRNFSQWIGGMGVLVFMLAVMPPSSASSVNLLKAELTGPSPDKIVPKLRETAKITYLIYLAMTVLLIVLLKIAGLPLYDSLVGAFSTAGTGGFSVKNSGIWSYGNTAVEIIMSVFMFLFGVNFSLYFLLFERKLKTLLQDSELVFYFGIVLVSIAAIAVNTAKMYGGIFEALQKSAFQVSSVVSTTGYATADFGLWPPTSQAILLILMFTGCCAGSTGGGIKLARIVILLKAAKIELRKIFHPGSVESVLIGKKRINDETVNRTALFFFVYFAVLAGSTILVSIDSNGGKSLSDGAAAVFASVNNIGIEAINPKGNYADYSVFSKLVFSFCMIAGRLEFFPVLVLFAPGLWKQKKPVK